MDINIFYESIVNVSDMLVSFFSQIMTQPNYMVWDFLTGNIPLEFTSFLGEHYDIALIIPSGFLDLLRDTIVTLIRPLFNPIDLLWTGYYENVMYVPFYMCFFSFFINSFLVVCVIKLFKAIV